MKFVYPIKDKTAQELYKLNREGQGGFYPIGSNNTYHGGVHFEGEHPVVAIADGEIIAYRFMKKYLEEESGGKTYKYSNCFMLVRHQYKTPKGQELVFYSHYNHLCPWDECSQNSEINLFTKPGYKIVGANRLPLFSEAIADSEHKLDSVLKKRELIAATRVDDMWAKTEEGHYFVHTDTTGDNKKYAEPADVPGQAPELDKLVTCKLPIKAGVLIGHSGLCEADGITRGYRAVHVEVFSGDDAEEFIKNPKADGKKNQLLIAEGATLYHRDKKHADISAIEKLTRAARTLTEIIDENSGSDWIQVTDKKIIATVNYGWLAWNATTKRYSVKEGHLNDIKQAFSSITDGFDINADSKFEYIGKLVESEVAKRKIRYPTPDTGAKKYWVKRSWLNGEHELSADHEDCCSDNPDAPLFTRVAGTVPYENVVSGQGVETVKDGDSTWYKVNPCGTEGWVKEADTQKVSPYDWPGFKVLKEEASILETYTPLTNTAKDSKIDYNSLPAYFKPIFDAIDTEAGTKGEITKAEMQHALKDPAISNKLSRLICYHQSEWWADEDMSYWEQVFKLLSPTREENLKSRIKELSWWTEVQDKTSGFPSQSVYHWNPVAFIDHIKHLGELRITIDDLVRIGAREENARKYVDGINSAILEFNINSPQQKAHFISQMYAETGSLSLTKENPRGLSVERARAAYGGPASGGDYRGRGLLQLTSSGNYTGYQNHVNEDITSSAANTEKLETSPHAERSAGWFWRQQRLNEVAEENDFLYLTYKVNGGFNGLEHRLSGLKRIAEVLELDFNTDYKFKESKIYNIKKACFGWGLWHDPEPVWGDDKKVFGDPNQRHPLPSSTEAALAGYKRFVEIHNTEGKPTIPTKWYYGNKDEITVGIREFVESRITQLEN